VVERAWRANTTGSLAPQPCTPEGVRGIARALLAVPPGCVRFACAIRWCSLLRRSTTG